MFIAQHVSYIMLNALQGLPYLILNKLQRQFLLFSLCLQILRKIIICQSCHRLVKCSSQVWNAGSMITKIYLLINFFLSLLFPSSYFLSLPLPFLSFSLFFFLSLFLTTLASLNQLEYKSITSQSKKNTSENSSSFSKIMITGGRTSYLQL